MKITPARFQMLLAQAREASVRAKEVSTAAAITTLSNTVARQKVDEVDLTSLQLGDKPSSSLVVDTLREVMAPASTPSTQPVAIAIAENKPGVSRNITLNEKQQLFNDTVVNGQSCVLIGAAGTGKTTSMKKVTRAVLDAGKLPKLSQATKHLLAEHPGGVIVSFTRKAVNNIRHAVEPELKAHTLTLHKLLEFAPVFFEIQDPNNPGRTKKTMKFEPSRCSLNPLPTDIKFIAFEESSMISVELYSLLQEAMPHKHQEVFLGDIQQLPPVFGLAILGFKLNELPVIELTEVYRQALNSPIISLAWKILKGDTQVFSPKVTRTTVNGRSKIQVPALDALSWSSTNEDTGTTSTVKFQVWQKPLALEHALFTIDIQIRKWIEDGYYTPTKDVILCPFNKSFGTVELNKYISQYLGLQREAIVHEVIAGFNKHYLAVGDRVLFDKEDAIITNIQVNGNYLGTQPQPASSKLDRWGHLQVGELTDKDKAALREQQLHGDTMSLEALEDFMSNASSTEDRVQASSHIVSIKYAYQDWDDDTSITLSSAAEINALLGGYALTVHKFQGSEERKVFILLHNSHQVMLSRELLYTAVTRAREELHIICETDSFYKGVSTQRIKGNTLKEKAEFFKGEKRKGKGG